jgi:hypothetical protein
MVRLAKEDPDRPGHVPLVAFRAVSRQALAWCVEAYQPVLFVAGDANVPGGTERAAHPLRPVLPATVEALDRFSAISHNPLKE